MKRIPICLIRNESNKKMCVFLTFHDFKALIIYKTIHIVKHLLIHNYIKNMTSHRFLVPKVFFSSIFVHGFCSGKILF